MKKTIYIFLLILCISAGSYFYHWKFIADRDILVDIEWWKDIIKSLNNDEISQWINNDNLLTTLSDKKYAIEFLDFCYKLDEVEEINSQEFIDLVQINELSQYMKNNNIQDPKDCIATEYLELNGLKQECIFQEDNWLHNPYIAAYLNWDIDETRFWNSLEVLQNFYLEMYPSNSYSLWALKDKLNGTFTSKTYCDTVVTDNYDDFIRAEDREHIYSGDNDNVLVTEGKPENFSGSTQEEQNLNQE